jgi:2',3'-cyclic-nucleotide 2'-phosphodiesterase (5'-nucleotidase family)
VKYLLAAFGMAVGAFFLSTASAITTDRITLSIVGTTDLHGFVFPRGDRDGLALLGGYVKNLREARRADGGAVLLLDAGDTYQGGIESNLSEGAIVVDAYNAMGYAAAAIGNHEFDFGAADGSGARESLGTDPRGAIKAIAARAAFPVLAANLIDDETARPVEWPNVHRSTMVTTLGVKVGVVGVMTINAMRATLPVNVHGLHVAPLAPAIATEAAALRNAGATVVVVTAHAGGSCAQFDDPADLITCDQGSEIFEVARSLPHGLVDAIVAGHTHDGLAHEVNDIAIVEGFALGHAFSRVDLTIDRGTGRVVARRPFAPRDLCARQDCDSAEGRTLPLAQYEGQEVRPDPAVDAAMAPALARVRQLQATPLGVVLDTPISRAGDLESALGNLFADALRESVRGADVAINNNSRGGLRTDLPAGPLTFGRLYDVFSFDNRLARLTISGGDLRQLFADEIRRGRRGALGISGVRVLATCAADGLHVEIVRGSETVTDQDRLTVVTMDSLAGGPVFGPIARFERAEVTVSAPVVREVVEEWFRARKGALRADQFLDPDRPRWVNPPVLSPVCAS